jgi:hypothetical protein
MNGLYRELADRMRGALPDLDRVVARVMRAWPRAERVSEDQEAYLDSVALNLHGFYSGLERLFEIIAKQIDETVPAGETWHKELLYQMTREQPGIRPGVISKDNAVLLDEFRRFRHLVRNVYTMNLVPEKIRRLISILPNLWPKLRAELTAFAEFSEDLGAA